MRRRARKCPLCSVGLTSRPGLPNSKQLDHIIPIMVGGTHTHGNVRIICALCNQRRPKDGRDYEGPVTLWAQADESVVSREHGAVIAFGGTCRKGLHPWIPENILLKGEKRKCRLCDEINRGRVGPRPCTSCDEPFLGSDRQSMCAPCIDVAAHRAAELHASGLSWAQVAPRVGYRTATGVSFAAKRIGYTPATGIVRPKIAPKVKRRCADCGAELPPHQPTCPPCRQKFAYQVLGWYRSGLTLEEIGERIGLRSKTSVTRIIRIVSDEPLRHGQSGQRQYLDRSNVA